MSFHILAFSIPQFFLRKLPRHCHYKIYTLFILRTISSLAPSFPLYPFTHRFHNLTILTLPLNKQFLLHAAPAKPFTRNFHYMPVHVISYQRDPKKALSLSKKRCFSYRACRSDKPSGWQRLLRK
jgi:hypothetical protein